MKKVRLLSLLFFVILILAINCKDDPPNSEYALKTFIQLYPEVEVIKVENTYIDPVLVCYSISYKEPDSINNKVIELAWVKDDKTGKWKLHPKTLRQLP